MTATTRRPRLPGRRRWVPSRYQLTTTECAAACLAMILSHHGRHTRVLECREALGLGRDGTSVRHLVDTAESYGLIADLALDDDPYAQPLTSPAIAYLRRGHFVVVEKVTRRSVRMVDPGQGRSWQDRAEFAEQFGAALVRFAPGPEFTGLRFSLRDNQVTRYLRDFVAVPGARRLLLTIAGLAVLLQLLGLALPLTTKYAVDTILPGHRGDLLALLGVAALGTAVTYGLITLLRSRMLLALRARADVLLTRRFVEHLLRLPLAFFLQRSRGDLLMRLGSVASTREALTQQVLTTFLDTSLLAGYAIGLAVLAPEYLLVVAVLATMQICVIATAYRRIRSLARRELIAKSEEQNYLVETLEAVAPVKANGFEGRVEARWRELFLAYRDAMLRRGATTAWIESAQGALGVLAPMALLWSGLWLVLDGRMTLGTMLAVNTLAMSVLAPIGSLVGTVQMFAMLRAQIERLYDVLDAAPEPSGSRRPPDGVLADVRVRGLTFSYHAEAPETLSGIDLSVPAGGKLGIVGRTGCGKSTLGLLLLGLLRAGSGTVSHNGIPVEELDVRHWRRSCGAVLQELTLFNGSIRDNLTLGRPDATDADVEKAATIAGLHDDILALPMRYRTIVGEGGGALSAGQRQRVALARALLHRPRLLLLDEATSHLDPETERRVDEELSHLNITRVVISHRVSAIRNADRIVVLDAGRIVASGRHDELVEQEGLYRTLFGHQPGEPANPHITITT